MSRYGGMEGEVKKMILESEQMWNTFRKLRRGKIPLFKQRKEWVNEF